MSALELALRNLAAWSVQVAVLGLAAAALSRLLPIERPAARLAFGQALLAVVQLQRANTGMVGVAQGQQIAQRPLLPEAAGVQRQQPVLGQSDQSLREVKPVVQVNRQRGQHVLVVRQPLPQRSEQGGG